MHALLEGEELWLYLVWVGLWDGRLLSHLETFASYLIGALKDWLHVLLIRRTHAISCSRNAENMYISNITVSENVSIIFDLIINLSLVELRREMQQSCLQVMKFTSKYTTSTIHLERVLLEKKSHRRENGRNAIFLLFVISDRSTATT